ncbi:ParB/RepB/Spo0J family partition protein [Sanguibacter suaedae]|uniref:ParB/RepB/Spo0J family partition protein n=1 Tax=Sanguibacter suaedae TaxID=2795737 RepID=A0A934M703_9MICO|nr:ParB/RepB/Spo0J family partition protein [Sanguibacter suaedae]MBI9114837.1 ParB/RepB/Spo0J family partition protein [Sanguibacter suaedae]
MSEKRRGLGRGLGALIPTTAEGGRPVDVFFPGAQPTAQVRAESGDEGVADSSHDGDQVVATVTAPGQGDGSQRSIAAAVAGMRAHRGRPEKPRTEIRIDSVSRETYEAATGDVPSDELVPVPGASFADIDVSAIHANSRQPRTVFDENDLAELVGSIREIGVLQPIVVRPSRETDGYELIMGERRWRATQAAGLDTIPAIIRETDDADLLRDALLENLHRSDLNPLEEAAAYQQLLDDFGCTHEELASRISRSRPQISNTLRLLRLPPLVQRRVAAGVLSAGHARALLGLSDGAEIERLAQRIVAEGLSVRATEEIVAMGGLEEKKPKARPRAGGRVQAIDDLAVRLSDRFETRVKVDLGKTKGKLTVEFASVEDLNRILTVMAPEEQGLFKG